MWTPLGLHHLSRYLILFTCVTAPIGILFRRYLVPVWMAAAIAASVFAVGPLAAFSVIAFVFSATVAGRMLFGSTLGTRLAFMAGFSLCLLCMTATAGLPIHYPATYWAVLSVPLLLGFGESRRLASEWLTLFRPRPASPAETLTWMLLAFVMGAHWLTVLKPEVSSDGLAMHLAIPMSMARFHVFDFDFRRYAWALSPLGADLGYSVLYTMGGEYAARLLNLTLLATTAVFLYRAARRLASCAIAIFITALFLSTPLVQLVTGSLFVENSVAAMCLAGAVALWRYRECRQARYLFLTALLLGTAISLKLAAFAVALLAVPFLVRILPRPRLAIPAMALFLVLACTPYLHAWWLSGNPLYPYANRFFHSPYVDDGLVDVRFHPSISWGTPLRLTVNTHDFFEGQNGAFGFQYFLFLPLSVVLALSTRCLLARSAAVIGIGGAAVIAFTQPNARYFFPVLPFLSIAAAGVLSWLARRDKPVFYFAITLASVALLVNIYFLPASNYYHRDFYSAPLFKASGRQEYLGKAAPVREVIAYLNQGFPTEPVFYTDSSLIAGLLAPAYRNSWHDYAFMKQVEACSTPQALHVLLAKLGVRHMIVDSQVSDRTPPVEEVIKTCGLLEYESGNFSAMQLVPDCASRLAAGNQSRASEIPRN